MKVIYEMAQDSDHSPRVSRKREARRRQIVRRALAIAASEGVETLTIQNLAADLDYTPGALYRYFPSKDALVAELQRSVVVFVAQAIDDVATRAMNEAFTKAPNASQRRDCLVGIAAACLAFVDFGHRQPSEFGLLSMYLSDPAYRLPQAEAGHVHTATREALAVLARLIEEAVADQMLEAGDAQGRALTAWAALQGVLQTRKLERNDPSMIGVERMARDLLRGLLLSWGAAPDHATAALALVDANGWGRMPASADEMLAATG